MRLVRIRQTSTGTDIPILLTTTPFTPIRRCCHTYKNRTVPEHGLQQTNTKKMLRTTQRKFSDSSSRQKKKLQNKKGLGKTFVTTKKSKHTQEEDSTHDEYDQDSSISFDDDEDSTASQEDDSEDWIEYIKMKRERC